MNNEDPKNNNEDSATANADSKTEKLQFGSLAPLTAAQIVTLLVGTTGSNSSYGGGY
ncbi:MAG: hypothetical protein H7281_04415 [Bacteriovorax sp.]|nr:hypothetical protein [Bacteriovorax sp.]